MASHHALTRAQRGGGSAEHRSGSAEPVEPAAAGHAPIADRSVPAHPVAGLIDGPEPAAAIQRRATGDDPLGGSVVDPGIDAALARRRGRGQALPEPVSHSFGEQFGADFSGVRIHTDPEADRIARAVSSVAFTQGNDIYFTQNSYAPTTEHGQHLLAHELTHVVQQGSGGAGGTAAAAGGTTIGRADDPAEHEAEQVARSIVPALRRQAAATASTAAGSAVADRGPEAAVPVRAGGLARTIRRDVTSLVGKFEKGAAPAETDPLKRFEQLVEIGTAPKDEKQARERMTELRGLTKSMSAQQRKVASSNKALMAKARTYVGDHEYMALVAAVSMYAQKYDLATGRGQGKSHHMSGAEADTFIRDNLGAIPHLKPYLEAAVAAGKQADGYVAVVGKDDWKAIYETQYPGEDAITDGATTNAFIANKHADRPAIINANKGTRSTAIHESMHRYSMLAVLNKYGSPLNEGMTEYFTRRITDADGNAVGGGGPSRTNYQSNFTFVSWLLQALGANVTEQETTLAEIYFNGQVGQLKTRFEAWGDAKGWSAGRKRRRWERFENAVSGGDWAEAKASMT